MKNKHVGILVIVISTIFLFLVFSFNNALTSIVNETCVHGNSCPMQTTLTTQMMLSYGLIAILIVLGIVIAYFIKDSDPLSTQKVKEVVKEAVKEHNGESKEKSSEERDELINSLEGEEKECMHLLLTHEGSMYQSDITKELKLTKVKITRLLDKLEGKGLVERKRRGMTNIVVLK